MMEPFIMGPNTGQRQSLTQRQHNQRHSENLHVRGAMKRNYLQNITIQQVNVEAEISGFDASNKGSISKRKADEIYQLNKADKTSLKSSRTRYVQSMKKKKKKNEQTKTKESKIKQKTKSSSFPTEDDKLSSDITRCHENTRNCGTLCESTCYEMLQMNVDDQNDDSDDLNRDKKHNYKDTHIDKSPKNKDTNKKPKEDKSQKPKDDKDKDRLNDNVDKLIHNDNQKTKSTYNMPYEVQDIDSNTIEVKNEEVVKKWREDKVTGLSCMITELDKTCSVKEDLRRNQLIQDGYLCDECPSTCKSKACLRQHKLVHDKENRYGCDTCNKMFRRMTSLEKHRCKHEVKMFSCNDCQKVLANKATWTAHMSTHNQSFVCICHLCGKGFGSLSYLQQHIRIHSVDKPHKCAVCGKSFLYQQSYQEHLRRHDKIKSVQCDECGKIFYSMRELAKHMTFHMTKSQYACTTCNMYFKEKSSILIHNSKVHSAVHRCDYCSEIFKNRRHLQSHAFKSHNVHKRAKKPTDELARFKRMICIFCKSSLSNKWRLKSHFILRHYINSEEIDKYGIENINNGTIVIKAGRKKASTQDRQDANVGEMASSLEGHKDEETMVSTIDGHEQLDSNVDYNNNENLYSA